MPGGRVTLDRDFALDRALDAELRGGEDRPAEFVADGLMRDAMPDNRPPFPDGGAGVAAPPLSFPSSDSAESVDAAGVVFAPELDPGLVVGLVEATARGCVDSFPAGVDCEVDA